MNCTPTSAAIRPLDFEVMWTSAKMNKTNTISNFRKLRNDREKKGPCSHKTCENHQVFSVFFFSEYTSGSWTNTFMGKLQIGTANKHLAID